ncbi:MAG: tetratricopeptide repeat protein [Gammaproteobacteria bacterium]|jgi:tetratricopeptide (TPR) repeat protein|nr:tetratricopeptide repeat protein [Gammaproteobacteria bacterium]
MLVATLILGVGPVAIAAPHAPTLAARQTRFRAFANHLQEDVKINTIRVRQQQRLIDWQNARIGDLSFYLNLFWFLFSIITIGVGAFGYFSIKHRAVEAAESEAKKAARDWFEDEGRKRANELLDQFKDELEKAKHYRAQIQTTAEEMKQSRDQMIGELPQLSTKNPSIQSVALKRPWRIHFVKLPIMDTKDSEKTDTLRNEAEALKSVPENLYTFTDWNTRAFDAYRNGNAQLAVEYWLNAAKSPRATPSEIASATLDAALALGFSDATLSRSESLCDKIIKEYKDSHDLHLRDMVARAYIQKGLVVAGRGRPDDSLNIYDAAIAYIGEPAELPLKEMQGAALVNKGATLHELGRYKEALDVLSIAIQKYDNAPDVSLQRITAKAFLQKSFSLRELGKNEEVLTVIEEIINRFSDTKDTQLQETLGLALVQKGASLHELGRYDNAIRAHDYVIEKFREPQTPALKSVVANANNGKGFTLIMLAKKQWDDSELRNQKLDESLGCFERALALDPDQAMRPSILGNKAYALFLRDQKKESESVLENALRIGGEALRDAELKDAQINPVAADNEFIKLVGAVWARITTPPPPRIS